jgi:hypothetical protein
VIRTSHFVEFRRGSERAAGKPLAAGPSAMRERATRLGRHTAAMLHENASNLDDGETEFDQALAQLEDFLSRDDVSGIVTFYEREFPKIMQLVPSRRRESLIRGVVERSEHDEDMLAY